MNPHADLAVDFESQLDRISLRAGEFQWSREGQERRDEMRWEATVWNYGWEGALAVQICLRAGRVMWCVDVPNGNVDVWSSDRLNGHACWALELHGCGILPCVSLT